VVCPQEWQGAIEETGSISAAPPAATSRSTFSRQHRFKDLIILQLDIHLIEIEYCEDTRTQSQLGAAQEEHKGLCSTLQGASVTLHTILLGVDGAVYNNHTLELFKELGLDSQIVEKPASNFQASCCFILSITQPILSIPDVPFPTLLSTVNRSRFQVKSATLLIPIDLFPFNGGGTRFQSGSFSSINVGSGLSLSVSSKKRYTRIMPDFLMCICFLSKQVQGTGQSQLPKDKM